MERARKAGLEASADGVDWRLSKLTARLRVRGNQRYVHVANAPRYAELGIRAITSPRGGRAFVVPSAKHDAPLDAMKVNMVNLAGQATIHRARRRCGDEVDYAEIVATVGRCRRAGHSRNIDEFTAPRRARCRVGRAGRGKAIIVLNPPTRHDMRARSSAFAARRPTMPDHEGRRDAVANVAIRSRLSVESAPQFGESRDGHTRVAVLVEVEGAGDYFLRTQAPRHMTAAAAAAGDRIANTWAASAPLDRSH